MNPGQGDEETDDGQKGASQVRPSQAFLRVVNSVLPGRRGARNSAERVGPGSVLRGDHRHLVLRAAEAVKVDRGLVRQDPGPADLIHSVGEVGTQGTQFAGIASTLPLTKAEICSPPAPGGGCGQSSIHQVCASSGRSGSRRFTRYWAVGTVVDDLATVVGPYPGSKPAAI